MDRDRYLFGGYSITQRIAGPGAPEAAPARIVTASPCLAPFVPDAWALEWATVPPEERAECARRFDLDAPALANVIRHVTAGFDAGDFGWTNVIMSTEALVGLLALLPPSPDRLILGLGLHDDHVATFLRENEPPANQGPAGHHALLRRRLPLPPGGELLGFEPLGFEHLGQPHSWRCNGVERDYQQLTGTSPNAHGLLDDERAARHVVQLMNDEVIPAEPVHWSPWILVEYSRTSFAASCRS